MKVAICLVSADAAALAMVRKEQTSLIPSTLANHERVKALGLSFHAGFTYDPNTSSRTLGDYLVEISDGFEVLLLLVDGQCAHLMREVGSSCFSVGVEFHEHPKTNYKNYFSGVFARAIKNLVFLLKTIGDGTNEQMMLLPFRTFKTAELEELRRSCLEDSLNSDFPGILERALSGLLRRRRPRESRGASDKYYVDNEGKLFKYGHERHARIATGDPHRASCVLAGTFRFGRRIATDRHFNVTKEYGEDTRIDGDFQNCHDEWYHASTVSHLNIFSNDYCA